MRTEVFTLGYQQRTSAEFVRILRAAAIDVVLDIRETAWSHKPGFSKSALRQVLQESGITYVHAPFAGNPKRLRSAAATHQEILARYRSYLAAHPMIGDMFDEVLGRLIDVGKRVCVICYERHPDDCHRGILLNEWLKGTCRRVLHLGADNQYRLS